MQTCYCTCDVCIYTIYQKFAFIPSDFQHTRLLFRLTHIIAVCRVVLSWAFLEVTTSPRFNDSIQAYAAGAVEAAVTSQVRRKDPVKAGSTIRLYCTAI